MRFLGTITLPAGLPRNNTTTACAARDLAGLAAGNLDSKVRAQAPGAGGNSIQVACVGDSGVGVGVVIVRVGLLVSIHFEDLVSTVAEVEAAIAAVDLEDRLLVLDEAGTGATVLAAATDEFAATNLTGGAAGDFVIPSSVRALRVLASATSGVESIFSDLASEPFATSAAEGFPLAANVAADFALPRGASPTVLAGFAAAGGTIRVWATEIR